MVTLQRSAGEAHVSASPNGSVLAAFDLPSAPGNEREAIERVEQAVAIRPQDFAVLYNAACSFANAGETTRALEMLDRAVATGRGFRAWIEHDPDLDSLRALPRFQEIVARLPVENVR
jgi:adenylate cyclase